MQLIILVILLLLLFGSRSLPGLGNQLGKKVRKPYQQAKWMWALLSGTEEEALHAEEEFGRECAREFAKQFPGTAPARDQELVTNIGSRLAQGVKDPRRRFRFAVVASASANAFALPGGFVFITQSLLDLCDRNPDEIAFFLGHEIAHVVCGHARDQMTADTVLNAIAARLAGAGGLLRQILVKGYSRGMELEADTKASHLAAAAGFDAGASARALKRLAQVVPDTAGLAEYFSSHPTVADRIRALE